MIKLYQFPSRAPLPNLSPFCFRVEAFLRLAALPYEVISVSNPSKAPKKKLPFLVDAGGQSVADSQLIIEHLIRTQRLTLDDHLSDADRAIAHAFTRMLMEHFYWVVVFSRWVDDEGWSKFKVMFLKSLPPVIGPVIAATVHRRTKRTLEAHGLGRHSPQEIWRMGEADLDALSTLLGDRDFFFGEQPSTFDATALAFLGCVLYSTIVDPPVKKHLRAHQNLVAFCDRMMRRCFPEHADKLPV
jgi:glutathione S-transferase